jgi:hypothetical protein
MKVEKVLILIISFAILSSTVCAEYQFEPEIKIEFSNLNPIEGDEIWLNVTINSTTEIENITVLFFCDGYPIGAENINLTVGENSAAIKWKAIAWEHEIKVQLAISGQPIPESALTKKIYVQPKKMGSTINVIIALVVIVLVIAAVAAAPSLREWLKWRKR